MLDYRLHYFDGTNQITHVEEIKATSDGEAIKVASAFKQSRNKCELWSRNRLVATIGTYRS